MLAHLISIGMLALSAFGANAEPQLEFESVLVSWAKVEPSVGHFDLQALNAYTKQIAAVRARGAEPVVTLYGRQAPAWFERAGGWRQPGAPRLFVRYAERVVQALHRRVRLWATFSDPTAELFERYRGMAVAAGASELDDAADEAAQKLRAHAAVASLVRAKQFFLRAEGGTPVGVGAFFTMPQLLPAHEGAGFENRQDRDAISIVTRLSHGAFLEAVKSGVFRWAVPPAAALRSGRFASTRVPEAMGTLDWIGVRQGARYFVRRDEKSRTGVQWLAFPEAPLKVAGREQIILKGGGDHEDEQLVQ